MPASDRHKTARANALDYQRLAALKKLGALIKLRAHELAPNGAVKIG
jgi:hypothetical protein